MRDKLIQILQKHTPRAMGGVYIKTADEILAALRCDTCRHWEQWDTSYGECNANSVNMDRLDTQSDFFCAKWEIKP